MYKICSIALAGVTMLMFGQAASEMQIPEIQASTNKAPTISVSATPTIPTPRVAATPEKKITETPRPASTVQMVAIAPKTKSAETVPDDTSVNPETTSKEQITIASGQRILLVGDSLAFGLKNPVKELVEKSGSTFDFVAKGGVKIGAFTKGTLAVELDDALTKRPQLVLVALGTNDEYENSGYAPTSKRLSQELVSKIKGTGAKVLWIGPPTLGQSCWKKKNGEMSCHDPSGEVTPLLAQTHAKYYFDSRPLNLKRPDNVHPSPKEMIRWTNAIFSWWNTSANSNV